MDAINTGFAAFAACLAKWAGSPLVFTIALAGVLIWAACGPFFDYSEGWMLLINTGTTICTFLMVFIIQNSQNRDGLAVQIKLDEIIRSIHGAKNAMINLEDLPQQELEELRVKFAKMAVKARKLPNKRAKTANARSAS
ncbi:MAG: low affinity iron permease family protein [Rhizobiales bacterium]|nr:low affinity iron permease family protein [Hyphomicrobiales bacterium]